VQHDAPGALLVVGGLLLCILLIRVMVRSRFLPIMLFFIALGVLLGWLFTHFDQIAGALPVLRLLGEAGLVMLLFKVGLEADLNDLRKQLPNALGIWFWNVVISGLIGYVAARYWLSLDLLSSLFVAVALTATSVGVVVGLWDASGRLHSRQGNLLLDVAEIDDLSTIVLMAVLVALAPVISAGNGLADAGIATILLQIFATLLVFLVLAAVFSRWLEPRLTAFFERRQIDHEPVMLVIACGFVIAALAEAAGLSLAIGAFLAGLAFSRDNLVSRERPIIQGMYDFFTPFFFIGLGLMVTPDVFAYSLLPGLALLVAAVIGKLLGAGLPSMLKLGSSGGLLMAVSMVPRSEIAMVVMQQGLYVGVSEQAFAAMLIVIVGTVLFTSLLLPGLIQRFADHQ